MDKENLWVVDVQEHNNFSSNETDIANKLQD
jgi:hypothetical protein